MDDWKPIGFLILVIVGATALYASLSSIVVHGCMDRAEMAGFKTWKTYGYTGCAVILKSGRAVDVNEIVTAIE